MQQMFRIARRHLFVIFFEGLKDVGEDEINSYPFDINNPDYAKFGPKFAAIKESHRGQIFLEPLHSRLNRGGSAGEAAATTVEFRTARNRPYIKSETILHMTR